MSNIKNPPAPALPPSRHQLAVMIWLCVFPTLTALNLTLADWLASMSSVVRTFVLATIAVPIVLYGLMPHLHRARARLLSSRTRDLDATVAAAHADRASDHLRKGQQSSVSSDSVGQQPGAGSAERAAVESTEGSVDASVPPLALATASWRDEIGGSNHV